MNPTPADVELKDYDMHSKALDPSMQAEEGEVLDHRARRRSDDQLGLMDSHDEQFPDDEEGEVETQQLTVRAVLVGCILGGVIAASNVYLGLKTGWSFGASFFGSILGYAILKPLSKALPKHLGGGYFGPKENVCCQSAATAAGSLGLLFASGFPAAYQLGILKKSPKEDFGRLITFTACCAYYGMFFAVPLRKLYILRQKLVFPSPTATAHTIRSLHVGAGAELEAKKKTKALILSFSISVVWRTISYYAPGILWDWHWGWTLYRLGWTNMIYAENLGFILEFTPAFLAAGALSGINASYSFAGGTILAWGVIAPALVTTGKAFGKASDQKYPEYVNYMSMSLEDPINKPSPRYWLLWPGVLLMLFGAFAELGANYKTLWDMLSGVPALLTKRGRDSKFAQQNRIRDPAPAHESVPLWMWTGGLTLSIIFTCVVLALQYGVPVGVSLLAILFAFILSIVGAESTGRTDITPITKIGNTCQVIVGSAIRNSHYPIPRQQLISLSGAMVAQGAAEQSSNMLGDLKTAHLMRASPRVQFYAQLIGSLVAIFMSAGMYVLFTTAYPCINDLAAQDSCSFSLPDVGSYRAIAEAVTSPKLPVPPSSGYTAIGLGIFAILLVIFKHSFVPQSHHGYVPNPVAMGLAFVLNLSTYSFAMLFGSTFAWLWLRRNPRSYTVYCYAVAAGMIAGEGIGGIVGAILEIAKVSGKYHGTSAGCPGVPGGDYCG